MSRVVTHLSSPKKRGGRASRLQGEGQRTAKAVMVCGYRLTLNRPSPCMSTADRLICTQLMWVRFLPRAVPIRSGDFPNKLTHAHRKSDGPERRTLNERSMQMCIRVFGAILIGMSVSFGRHDVLERLVTLTIAMTGVFLLMVDLNS